MKNKIVNAETEDGQRLGEVIIEAVENQLATNEPKETRETLERLMELGESRENAMRHIASALTVEIFDGIKNNNPYNEQRYLRNLEALPEPPK